MAPICRSSTIGQENFDLFFNFFFFQAEDGIRDRNVTGVQTCALPIYLPHEPPVVPGVEIHACLLASALNAAGRIRPKRLRVKSGRATLLRIREMAAGK